MKGMTLKQMAKQEFFTALEAYRQAETNKDFIIASVRLHAASGNVPKHYRRLVRSAYAQKGQVTR